MAMQWVPHGCTKPSHKVDPPQGPPSPRSEEQGGARDSCGNSRAKALRQEPA